MNEGGGTKIFDISGDGRNGILTNGVKWGVGQFGSVLDFDGLGQYVDIPKTEHYDIITVSAWVAPNSAGQNSAGMIVGKDTTVDRWTWNVMTSNRLQFRHGWTSSNGRWNTPVNVLPQDGSWHNVVVIYDSSSSANDPEMYIDGVSQTIIEGNTPAGSAITTSQNYIIGNRTSGNRTFDGQIDDVRIYNRALSRQEIREIYLNPFAPWEKKSLPSLFFISVGGDITVNPNTLALSGAIPDSNRFVDLSASELSFAASLETAEEQLNMLPPELTFTSVVESPAEFVNVLPGELTLISSLETPTEFINLSPNELTLVSGLELPTEFVTVLPGELIFTLIIETPVIDIGGGNVTILPNVLALNLTSETPIKTLAKLTDELVLNVQLEQDKETISITAEALGLSFTIENPVIVANVTMTPDVLSLSLIQEQAIPDITVIPNEITLNITQEQTSELLLMEIPNLNIGVVIPTPTVSGVIANKTLYLRRRRR